MNELLQGLVIGLNAFSVHTSDAVDSVRNDNIGIYAFVEDGVAGGVFNNSLGRTSFWLGKDFKFGNFSVIAGTVTGYEFRSVKKGQATHACEGQTGQCYTVGRGKKFQLMVAPSYLLPEVLGVRPRATLMLPRYKDDAVAINFSFEWGGK